ncbi:pilus assembly protein TadG-related protein [Neotabrizicola sp. sgz301269]|uniref:TadE/TadG family type IV pilus assembly protein n=1 Tax=Neotabrizicola sp. sgz301269 TaxID=3276282 RepID=UPI00376FAF61
MMDILRFGLQRAQHRTRRFRRDEAGVMAPQILFFFFMMILVGGVAVDVMRFETKRVAVQNTMDRATLAAASLEQSLNGEDVVRDFFTKAGLQSELDSISVDKGMNYKIVQAKATVKSGNYFMSLMEIPYLESQTRSQAEQRVTNVEIALVLDVSGSMYNSFSRITNLKAAAKDFVDTVLSKDTENKISIAIVPYNGQVNIGPDLYSKFTKSYAHSFAVTSGSNQGMSQCLDLPTSTYANTTLSRSTAYPQTPFADAWSSTSQSTSYVSYTDSSYGKPTYDSGRALYSNVWCQPIAANVVRPFNNNRSVLKNQIDGLVAVGATSIDLGMKWGAFLVDPSSQGINSELAAAGKVPSYFSARPAAYGDRETLKVIVLMTDGENFVQERFNDGYRTGDASGSAPIGSYPSGSPYTYSIWRATDGNYSVFQSNKVDSSTSTKLCNSRPFWVPHLGAWHSRPWNGTTPSTSACYSPTGTYTLTARQTWEQVFQTMRVQYVAWQFFARAQGTTSSTRSAYFNAWTAAINTSTDTTTMDTRLNTVCSSAKTNGVLVYGIAFESTTNGANAIRNCASSPASSFFFDVSGLEIKTAFALIASNLSQLRLTQ